MIQDTLPILQLTQCDRIKAMLKNAMNFGDGFVDGMEFLNLDKPILQYHARIYELEREGYVIEHQFVESKNWKKYKLICEPKQQQEEQNEKPDS